MFAPEQLPNFGPADNQLYDQFLSFARRDRYPSRQKVKCHMCNDGVVMVDPNDRRKGETSCWKCNGTGWI